MSEKFLRTELLLGTPALEKLRRSRVAIFGIGGVGSYVAEALVRCGVGHFLLVDNDVIDITNINRQIHATTKTVGQAKTEVMAARMRDINPEVEIITLQKFYSPENREDFFRQPIDYLVDAIDSVPSKADLLAEAVKRDIQLISSMGAGNKLNPAMLQVADLYKTSVCPLARTMRQRLRKLGVKKLKVVYSQEEPIKHRLTQLEGEEFTKLVPGSISFVPSSAGLLIASEVVKDLCQEYL